MQTTKLSTILLAVLLPSVAAGPDYVKGNACGDPKAPIMIEIFSDFQCPACKQLHDQEVPLLMKDFVSQGKVYLIYRYFPLPGHAYGRPSAEYASACAQVGKYEEASNLLFARQAMWSADGKVEQTVDSILTPAEQKKVKALINEPVVQNQIAHDLYEGRAVPVPSTPTLLVTRGLKRYPLSGAGVLNYNLLKPFLNELLAK